MGMAAFGFRLKFAWKFPIFKRHSRQPPEGNSVTDSTSVSYECTGISQQQLGEVTRVNESINSEETLCAASTSAQTSQRPHYDGRRKSSGQPISRGSADSASESLMDGRLPAPCQSHVLQFLPEKVEEKSEYLSVEWPKMTSACKTHHFERRRHKNSIIKCVICETDENRKTYKCSKCGLSGHSKCLKQSMVLCSGRIQIPRLPMFNVNLLWSPHELPDLLVHCVSELESRGYDKLIEAYKSPPNTQHITILNKCFNWNPNLVDLSDVSSDDIASLVKNFIFNLNPPLLDQRSQTNLIELAKSTRRRSGHLDQKSILRLTRKLSSIIAIRDPIFRMTLAYIVHHLRRIVVNNPHDIGSSMVLAVNFAVCLFPNNGICLSTTVDAVPKAKATEFLIHYAKNVF